MNESIEVYCSRSFVAGGSWFVCVAVVLLAFIAFPLSADEQNNPDEVGRVTLIIGQALAHNQKGEQRSLKRGDSVYVAETIETSAGGHVHLRFIDEGTVSLRPNSRLGIELYHYDKLEPKNSAIRFNLESGVIRSISGKATQAAHDRFRLNTPITAIGVLGTDFVVRAEPEKMWAGVYSGAIAIAALSDQCSANGLGACGGATRLSEAMGSVMIEFNDRREKEKIVPLDPAVISKATSSDSKSDSNSMGSNDSDSTVHPKEEFPQASSGRITVEEIKAANVAASLGGLQPSPPQSSRQLQPSPFVWGRWHEQRPGDTMTKPYPEAREGRIRTVGTEEFILFRAPSSVAELEPHAGTYDFQLQQGQVHFVGNGVSWQTEKATIANLDAATLQVDFAQRQFNTHLEMSHPRAGSASLDLSGSIQNNGTFIGQDATGRVAGALSPEGEHAGMYFQRDIQSGSFQGLTDWAK